MNSDRLSDLPDWWDDALIQDPDSDRLLPYQEGCKKLYQKWQLIFSLLRGLLDKDLPEDSDNPRLQMLRELSEDILSDAQIAGAKIYGAVVIGTYVLRMEQAAFIRKYAQDIHTRLILFLESDDYEPSYVGAVRQELQEFRLLFRDWVGTFGRDGDEDEWGLF